MCISKGRPCIGQAPWYNAYSTDGIHIERQSAWLQYCARLWSVDAGKKKKTPSSAPGEQELSHARFFVLPELRKKLVVRRAWAIKRLCWQLRAVQVRHNAAAWLRFRLQCCFPSVRFLSLFPPPRKKLNIISWNSHQPQQSGAIAITRDRQQTPSKVTIH